GSTEIDWTGWEIEHNGIYEAGTIRIDIPSRHDANNGSLSWAWFTQQTEILVDVFAGFPRDPLNYSTADLTLLMTARADKLVLDPYTSAITLHGRDLSGLLIDNKTDDKYPNMTASQIATLLAEKYGLTPKVTPTTEKVGNFYTLDHVRMTAQDTPWTLLSYLAQHEGFQCFVLGRTLYFGKFQSVLSPEPYLIQFTPPNAQAPYPESNATQLRFEHDLTLAQDVSVRVRSYHGAKNAAYSATATATKTQKRHERDVLLAQMMQNYDYTFPGLTQQQCQQKANQILAEISHHELKMEARFPGDTLIFPWTQVQVVGTDTIFDTTYNAARIVRWFDDRRGFGMRVNGKTSPLTQTVSLS
ncbi:MAG TPA: hypothetical protein PLK99_12840, partial [Burkholderiales bacterium]|nr:hypothetical protein [Burkholderiales bacterium]